MVKVVLFTEKLFGCLKCFVLDWYPAQFTNDNGGPRIRSGRPDLCRGFLTCCGEQRAPDSRDDPRLHPHPHHGKMTCDAPQICFLFSYAQEVPVSHPSQQSAGALRRHLRVSREGTTAESQCLCVVERGKTERKVGFKSRFARPLQ